LFLELRLPILMRLVIAILNPSFVFVQIAIDVSVLFR
jgi:hypothetical protein